MMNFEPSINFVIGMDRISFLMSPSVETEVLPLVQLKQLHDLIARMLTLYSQWPVLYNVESTWLTHTSTCIYQ